MAYENIVTHELLDAITIAIQAQSVGELSAGGQVMCTLATETDAIAMDDDVDALKVAQIDGLVLGATQGAVYALDSYTTAAIDVAAGGPTELIAAPGANKQIWVYGVFGMANVAGTINFQDDTGTPVEHSGTMTVGIAGGFVMPMSGSMNQPWFKVATNQALDIVTVTCTFDGTITYGIVDVS